MARHSETSIPVVTRYRLARSRVPLCFLKDLGFLKDLARGPDGGDEGALVDIVIEGEEVAGCEPSSPRDFADMPTVDLEGRQVWPTLVDMHAHLDKGQAIPRAMPDGTLDRGAAGTAADRRFWTADDIARRMDFSLRCAYAHGVSAIRTHIDSHHELTARVWAVFREMRQEWRGRIELQGVGLAPLDFYRGAEGARLADLVVQSDGVLGGVTDGIGGDWAETSAETAPTLDRFLSLAAERGLDVDLHVDQSANVRAFALPHIADAVLRARFAGTVVCGHCVDLALQPEDVANTTIARCAEAGIAFVTLPTPMMYLMDRLPGRTPRWRGVTAAKEISAAGIPLAIGGDNCRDAWFAYGDHDMLDTFQQAVRVLQLDHPLGDAPAMVGPVPAAIIGEPRLGWIAAGMPARLILFSGRTLGEIMCRPQSDRIVIDRGLPVMTPLPDYSELDAPLGPPAPTPAAG